MRDKLPWRIYLYFSFLHGIGGVGSGNTTRMWLGNHYHYHHHHHHHHAMGDKAAVVRIRKQKAE